MSLLECVLELFLTKLKCDLKNFSTIQSGFGGLFGLWYLEELLSKLFFFKSNTSISDNFTTKYARLHLLSSLVRGKLKCY